MANTHSLIGYRIPFERELPTRSLLLKGDIAVTSASGLPKLGHLLSSGQIDDYVTEVVEGYKRLERGSLTVTGMQRIVESSRKRAKSYWGHEATDIPVRILPVAYMRDAAREHKETLNRALGESSPIEERERTPYLPSFIDHLNGELILSEQCMSGDFPDSEKETGLFPWNEKNLEAMVILDLGTHVIRSLRGETGDGYIEMLRNVPENMADDIYEIVRNASVYALREGLQDGGVPVLYLRLLNIFRGPKNAASYFPIEVLADVFGVKIACLWDVVDFEKRPLGVDILGYLTTRHPNHQEKYSRLVGVLQPYGYESSGTFPESLLSQPSG